MGCLNVNVKDLGYHLNGLTIIDVGKHLNVDVSFVCVVSDTDYEIFLVSDGVFETNEKGNFASLRE